MNCNGKFVSFSVNLVAEVVLVAVAEPVEVVVVGVLVVVVVEEAVAEAAVVVVVQEDPELVAYRRIMHPVHRKIILVRLGNWLGPEQE